jgi:aldose 1-epimerase
VSDRLVLETASLRLELVPAVGGAVARLDWIGGGPVTPLLRPIPAGSTSPGETAMFPLVPWSNRIDGGGFAYGGRFWPIAPNSAGDPRPIHGHGWLEPWAVAKRSDAHAVLVSRHADDVFSYVAELDYRLDGVECMVTLAVRNAGERAMPFGLGLHPWFPRKPGTRVQAPARGVWHEGPGHLPTVHGPIPPDWDFSAPRKLAPTWANNGFTGWSGRATIHQPDDGLALTLTAEPLFASYILYTPVGADSFCLEPVSHMIDAHNRAPGELARLAPGEALSGTVRFAALDLRGGRISTAR